MCVFVSEMGIAGYVGEEEHERKMVFIFHLRLGLLC